MMDTVFLLTTGDGDYGNQWNVEGVYSTYKLAREAKINHDKPKTRPDGSTYSIVANIEEWPIDKDYLE